MTIRDLIDAFAKAVDEAEKARHKAFMDAHKNMSKEELLSQLFKVMTHAQCLEFENQELKKAISSRPRQYPFPPDIKCFRN